jgi:L-arabinonolactonase
VFTWNIGAIIVIEVSIAVDTPDILGEAPQWRASDGCLYWVDAFAPAIRRLTPQTGVVVSYNMPTDIGSFVFTHDGSLVCGMRSGFNHVRLETNQITGLINPLGADERLMLNDGKCDRHGRYWCASVHSDFIGREAKIYRLDPDLSVHQMDGGFLVGNGIAFSPDDTLMYFADSRDETVWVYDFDIRTGQIFNRRLFYSTRNIEGRVDGATCDCQGNYWCALVFGAAVACISPAGKMIERISVPAKHPTMVAFGGTEYETLYVTSASSLLTAAERPLWPHAGKLFRIDGLNARGMEEPMFNHNFDRNTESSV